MKPKIKIYSKYTSHSWKRGWNSMQPDIRPHSWSYGGIRMRHWGKGHCFGKFWGASYYHTHINYYSNYY
jgi:hypothetical protein